MRERDALVLAFAAASVVVIPEVSASTGHNESGCSSTCIALICALGGTAFVAAAVAIGWWCYRHQARREVRASEPIAQNTQAPCESAAVAITAAREEPSAAAVCATALPVEVEVEDGVGSPAELPSPIREGSAATDDGRSAVKRRSNRRVMRVFRNALSALVAQTAVDSLTTHGHPEDNGSASPVESTGSSARTVPRLQFLTVPQHAGETTSSAAVSTRSAVTEAEAAETEAPTAERKPATLADPPRLTRSGRSGRM